MYIRLLDGSLPKFVTCTSEPAAIGGVAARNTAAVRKPAAMSTAAHVASSERNHRFMSDPFDSKCFAIRNLSNGRKFPKVYHFIALLKRRPDKTAFYCGGRTLN